MSVEGPFVAPIDTGALDTEMLRRPQEPPLEFVESYSGIRGHFGALPVPPPEARVIALCYAYCFAENVARRWHDAGKPKRSLRLVVGRDSRPSSLELARLQQLGFTAFGRRGDVDAAVVDLGLATTPLAQAAVRALDADGGVMVTGSHNPLRDNGLKYLAGNVEPEPRSRNDRGAVLDGHKIGAVIDAAHRVLQDVASGQEDLIESFAGLGPTAVERIDGPASYRRCVHDVFRLTGPEIRTLRDSNDRSGRRIVVDPNGGGGSRVVPAILGEFVDVVAINSDPGRFAHRIEPVGEALEGVLVALAAHHAALGVVLDADADRGNLVIAGADGLARELHPQEVAALNVAGMLTWATSHADRYPEIDSHPLAVVAHGATSSRVRDLARRFGAELFEVETGEVNVVACMRHLTRAGYFVPIGVEGSNGGSVFHGTQVRDGALTALMALLLIADTEASRADTAADAILAAIPEYETIQSSFQTPVVDVSQAAVKAAFEELFLALSRGSAENFRLQGLGSTRFSRCRFFNYEGAERLQGRGNRVSQTGGLKVLLTGADGRVHFFWFRTSKTESGVVRAVADSPDAELTKRLYGLGRDVLARAFEHAAAR